MDIESNEWEERYSKKHDRKYWKNKNTGESSWKDPNKINSKKKRSDNTKESNNNGCILLISISLVIKRWSLTVPRV